MARASSSLIRQLRLLSSSKSSSRKISSSAFAAQKLHEDDRSNNVSAMDDSTPVDGHAQGSEIKRLAKSGNFSEIEKLIHSRKEDPTISIESYAASLITSYGYADMIDRAIKTFDEMGNLGSPRTVLSFNALLSACNHTGNHARVPELFTEISNKHGIVPDKISYGILIKSLCLSRSIEKVHEVMTKMEEEGMEITPVTYTTLLDTLYRDKKASEAERLWKEMERKGCSFDVAAYNVKLMYYAVNSKPETLIKLIEEMSSAGLKPDIISYNYLITCYCKNGEIEEAKSLYRSLGEKGCRPNTALYRNLMYLLCKNKDFDAAKEVCVEGVKKNKIPDLGPMKMLIEGLVKDSKLEDARELMRLVRKKFSEKFISRWKNIEEKLGLEIEDGSPNAEGA